MKPFSCSRCQKRFTTRHGAEMHIRDTHDQGEVLKVKPPRHPRTREESMAEIAVDALLKRSMGEPLDELESSLIDWEC